MSTPRLALSVTEAASSVGLSEDVIREAIKAGDLAAYKPMVAGRVLNRIRIDTAELTAWLRAGAAA